MLKEMISQAENPKFYGVGFLLSCLAAVLVLVVIAVLGEYTKTLGRFLLTALLVAGYCMTSLGPVVLVRGNIPRIVSAGGLVLPVLALVMLLVGVWGTPNSDGFWKGTMIATLLAVVFAYASWTHGLNLKVRTARWAARLSSAAAMLGVAVAGVGITFELKEPPYWWAFTLIALLWAIGGIFVPLSVLRGRRLSNQPLTLLWGLVRE